MNNYGIMGSDGMFFGLILWIIIIMGAFSQSANVVNSSINNLIFLNLIFSLNIDENNKEFVVDSSIL